MKKFLGKGLLVAIVMGLGIFAGSTMVSAQFNTVVGDAASKEFQVDSTKNLIQVVKAAINRVLAMLMLIALALALYGGFQMVTAAGDEGKYKGGFKVLKQAAIGLAIVALSWIIVNTVFLLVGALRTGNQPITS